MTKSGWPYSTGAPPATRTSRISPSAGALISAMCPSDWMPPSTSPRFTSSPAVHSRPALKMPTVVAWTRWGFSAPSVAAPSAARGAVGLGDQRGLDRRAGRVVVGVCTGVRLLDERIDHAGLEQVGSGELHRLRRALGLGRAPPEDRRAAFG